MKLFLIEINNGWDYADYDEQHKLVVAKDIVNASIKAVGFMNENYDTDQYATPEFHVTEIKQVDGYKVNLKNNRGE